MYWCKHLICIYEDKFENRDYHIKSQFKKTESHYTPWSMK